MSDTNFIMKRYPELKEIINKYDLRVHLDDFGMGNIVFYKGKEVGYWFHWDRGITMRYTKAFGLHEDLHSDYELLGNGIEKRITKYLGERLGKEPQ